MSSSTGEAPKKKRRQNVACDACKLRRVKCDLVELLSSTAGPSLAASTDDPLHLLVRRHPEVSCTNCRNKGVQCSTEGILNPIRPNKGGRRIQEAREKFGGENTGLDIHPNGLDGGTPYRSHVGDHDGSTDFLTSNTQSFLDSSYTDQDTRIDGLGDLWQLSTYPPGSEPPHTVVPDHLADTILADIEHQLLHVQRATPDQPVCTSIPTPLQRATPDIQRQALYQWEQLSVNTPQTIANRSARSSPLPTVTPVLSVEDLDGHTSHLESLVPALGRLDIETNQFLPVLPIHAAGNRTTSYPSQRGPASDKSSAYEGDLVRYRAEPSVAASSSGYSGKRFRSEESASRSGSPGTSVSPGDERDPWHIWQDGEQSLVAWSRKDQVQESLADRALGIELSRHLVTVYFQAVHFSLPVLSPESFYLEWEACGRRSDRMNPAQEALCAVIEAWAARYSDNPAVLGLPYQRAHTAPKVITDAGQFAPGTQARAHWGKARLPVCNALLDRAGRIIDTNAVMRRPSVTGLQALALYNQLMHMSDQGSRVKDQWIQNMMVHSTVVEQMKLLRMLWTAGDPILTADDSDLDALQVRMKQRRLFWTTAVSDSCWAAATGMTPKMPEEELAAGRAWVDEVMDTLPNSTMKVLAFFMKIWHRLAMVGREVSSRVTKYNDRKGNIPVAEFCASVRSCWSELRSITTELNESAISLLGACEPGVLGFSPLNYMTNMRLCCPFFLLVLHEAIRNNLAFRQSLYGSYIVEPELANVDRRNEELVLLDKLHLQSVDVLLYNCRSQMALFKTLLPTGIIQSASAMIRVLIASGQFLAEVPTIEQGYPSSTLGGCGWTWEAKQRIVSICSDALYQVGWAWSDVTAVLEAIHLAMERMTPEPDVLAAYNSNPPPINVKIQTQRSREARIEDQGIQSALEFWPPQSIPNIIASSTAGTFADTPLIPRGVPGSDLGHLLHARSLNSTPSSGSSAAGSSWLGQRFTSNNDATPSSTFDGVPGFDTLTYVDGAPRSGQTMSNHDDLSVNETFANLPDDTLGIDGDAFLWDLINGTAGKDDVDFDAFLQDFGDG